MSREYNVFCDRWWKKTLVPLTRHTVPHVPRQATPPPIVPTRWTHGVDPTVPSHHFPSKQCVVLFYGAMETLGVCHHRCPGDKLQCRITKLHFLTHRQPGLGGQTLYMSFKHKQETLWLASSLTGYIFVFFNEFSECVLYAFVSSHIQFSKASLIL